MSVSMVKCNRKGTRRRCNLDPLRDSFSIWVYQSAAAPTKANKKRYSMHQLISWQDRTRGRIWGHSSASKAAAPRRGTCSPTFELDVVSSFRGRSERRPGQKYLSRLPQTSLPSNTDCSIGAPVGAANQIGLN